jgi:beta-phosphoglucomutase-like phosphatase (HAD superfamily)
VDPSRAVVVEDSATGATAAARAGMRCLGYAPHGDGARLASAGAEIFDSMFAVPMLIGLAEAAE